MALYQGHLGSGPGPRPAISLDPFPLRPYLWNVRISSVLGSRTYPHPSSFSWSPCPCAWASPLRPVPSPWPASSPVRVGGLVVGSISGSPLGVSGPAAGLTAIVLMGIQDLGAYEAFLVAVVISGALQVLLGFLRAGIIAYYFPSAVIKGMLAGIGVIIMLKQIPHAIGYDRVPLGDESFDQPDKENTFSELIHMMEGFTPGALVVTLLCIGLMLLWERPFIQRNQWLRYIPGPLLAVLAGILLSSVFRGVPALVHRP